MTTGAFSPLKFELSDVKVVSENLPFHSHSLSSKDSKLFFVTTSFLHFFHISPLPILLYVLRHLVCFN